MWRRQFVGLVGGAFAWPLTLHAQQPSVPVVGFLRSSSRADATNLVAAFRRGLEEAGFIEGQNVEVDYRFADNQIERVPEMAAGLIRRPVAVLFGDSITANAAKAATTTIPIVFAIGADPVGRGLLPASIGQAATSLA
jgi:putative ABC transport system substrate-binding protein